MKSYATNVWNNWLFLYTSPHGSSGYISPAQNQKYGKVKQWPNYTSTLQTFNFRDAKFRKFEKFRQILYPRNNTALFVRKTKDPWTVFPWTDINLFSTNVPFTDKPGNWFLQAKHLKNICGRMTF